MFVYRPKFPSLTLHLFSLGILTWNSKESNFKRAQLLNDAERRSSANDFSYIDSRSIYAKAKEVLKEDGVYVSTDEEVR